MGLVKRKFFYEKISVSDSSFPSTPQVHFPFTAHHIILSTNNEEGIGLFFSFNGIDIDGELNCSDGPLVFDGMEENRIWLKSSAVVGVKIWGWRAVDR